MSETKVKKVNKMKIAVISLASALVLAVGGMIGIYAATQQSVGASFTVKYSIGDNVAVAIGGAVRRSGNEDVESWFTCSNSSVNKYQGDPNLYEISAVQGNDLEATLVGGNITVENPSKTVDVCFYFMNLSDEKSFSVKFIDNIQPVNMQYTILGAYQDSTTRFDTMPFEVYAGDGVIYTESCEVAPGALFCFVMEVMCVDQNKSASLVSDATKGISFVVEQA